MTQKSSYKETPAWQQSMQLAADMYQYTAQLPPVERLNLALHLQQKAVAIPSLIAGGSRGGREGVKKACAESLALLAEVETLLIISSNQYPAADAQTALEQHDTVEQLLRELLHRVSNPPKMI